MKKNEVHEVYYGGTSRRLLEHRGAVKREDQRNGIAMDHEQS